MKKSIYRKPNNTVRVAVVENHTLVRQTLVYTLKKELQVVVALQAENGEDFLSKLPEHKIDVVLLDLDMPVMDGRETLRILRRDYPEVKAIMLSMHEDPWIVSELIHEGAKSYLKKDCSFDEMVNALFDVKFKGNHSNELVESAIFGNIDHALKFRENSIRYQLNSREMLVLKLICDGKTSEEIAHRMNLSKKSIDAIRSDLLKRIGAKNPLELSRKSTLLGLYKARTDQEIAEEEQLIELEKNERKRSRMKDFSSDDEIGD
jgi:two-component system, NarL family, response regulator DegU